MFIRAIGAVAMAIALMACGKGSPSAPSPGPPSPGPGIPPPPAVISTTVPVIQQLYLGIRDGTGLGQVFWWMGRYEEAVISANVEVKVTLYVSVPPNVAGHMSIQLWRETSTGDWQRIGNGVERPYLSGDGNANSGTTFNLPGGPGNYKVICLVVQTNNNARSGVEGPFKAMD